MSKQVDINVDYDEVNVDRIVVDNLNQWASDNLHKVDFIDMSKVASGSVSDALLIAKILAEKIGGKAILELI